MFYFLFVTWFSRHVEIKKRKMYGYGPDLILWSRKFSSYEFQKSYERLFGETKKKVPPGHQENEPLISRKTIEKHYERLDMSVDISGDFLNCILMPVIIKKM